MTRSHDESQEDARVERDLGLLEEHLVDQARLAWEEPREPRTEEENADLAALVGGFERARDRWLRNSEARPATSRGPSPWRVLLLAALVLGLMGLAWKFWPRPSAPIGVEEVGNVRGRSQSLDLRVTPGRSLDGEGFETLHFVWAMPAGADANGVHFRLAVRDAGALVPVLEFDSLRGETLSLTRAERAELEAGRDYVAEIEMFMGGSPTALLFGRAGFRVD